MGFPFQNITKSNFGESFIKWIDVVDIYISIYIINNGAATPLPYFQGEVRQVGVLFHPFYLPLAAAVNQNVMVIIRKGINVENKEFKCISFANDLTESLMSYSSLTAHVHMMNAQDLSLRRTKKTPNVLMGISYRTQEVLNTTNVNEPLKIFGMIFFTYVKHKRE